MAELDIEVRAGWIGGINSLSAIWVQHVQHAAGIAGNIRRKIVSQTVGEVVEG